jgi:RHH-type proline utilization regulon transcriptional repressor/proline dehydrogenase/delta 1-pyrroline-5-carboxylate dehydrogenase
LLAHVVDSRGIPESLPWHERVGLKMASEVGPVLPGIVMPAVTAMIRRETRAVVLPGDPEALRERIAKRRSAGARLNLNMLGEAILGEGEAERRLGENLAQLEGPDCDYLSVKISSIFSQINVLAYDDTLERLKEPLRRLYRAAMANRDASGRAKFVNLDMEEYRDLHLTLDVFRAVLEEEEFRGLEAGIVLQAYLPDSFVLLRDLTDWARQRVADGGAAIKVRLVKGANLAMEQVDAAVHGWEQAPYGSKEEVDANFKRLLHFACRADNAAAVRVGVGSHNLFDVAYALLLRAREGVEERVELEMLEGMASYQARVVEDLAKGMLFYAPVVKDEDFTSAIAYLVRRLDENTAPQNFLRHLFAMEPGDATWGAQRDRFLEACKERESVASRPNREQNRDIEYAVPDFGEGFENAADTDWTREENRGWIWREMLKEETRSPITIPLQLDGKEWRRGEKAPCVDPSKPDWKGDVMVLANAGQVEKALAAAEVASLGWDSTEEDRARLLKLVACALGRERGSLIAAMVRDGGKTVAEADAELSEAIDFANYYADSLGWDGLADGVENSPLGVVVVAPPWNFPLAIACGGVLAALMAGNAVILKPSPDAGYAAWRMAEVLWDAGVPRELLQFVAVPEDEVGRALLTDARVGAVILTGAYETAALFLGWNPAMRLLAETSGKNALIITAAADIDQAVKDLVKSAFGHAGQKCSAASLAIVEAEVYDDPAFRRQLRDAAESLVVGSAWELSTTIPPLIAEPGETLERGLTVLEEGEEWLLEPRQDVENPRLWSPGIKLGVQRDGWFRGAECFGPVLGVMRAADFEEALEMQNESAFGLTGGLHSLDMRQVARWRDQVEVGNAYVNRPTTGAIVRRQPFGGWKHSAVGPGAKAGGPNYVLQLAHWREQALPTQIAPVAPGSEFLLGRLMELVPEAAARLRSAAGSYRHWWDREFGVEHDPSRILGESNIFRYRSVGRVLIRGGEDDLGVVGLVLLAAQCAGVEVDWSVTRESRVLSRFANATGVELIEESAGMLAEALTEGTRSYPVIRGLKLESEVRRAAIGMGIRIADDPVLANGRLELRHYLKEQAISETVHRYGNVRES